MSIRTLIPMTLLLAVGCGKPPPEAPKELGELGAFLFQHFDDEDTEELAVGMNNLRDFLLEQDYSGVPSDNAVTMPILKGDDLGSLTAPAGVDPEAQINVAMPAKSNRDLDTSLIPALEPNQICIESSTTTWAERTFLSDTACFIDHSCEYMEVSNEVRKENFLAKVWYDQYKTYRWVMVPDEDGNEVEMLIARSWIEKQFEADGGGGNSWDQLYQLDVYIPNPDKDGETLRWFSMWSSITLGGFGDDLYAASVRSGIEEGFTYAEEFIADDIQTCKNDRDAEKPPRE